MNTVRSWDIFDTIIGRKCGTPARLWSLVGALAGIEGFVEMRRNAETVVQTGWQDYTIHDIYKQLANHSGFSDAQADDLCQRELTVECEQAFPIAQYASRVKPGDIAVSDMYLSAAQIRTILDAAGIEKDLTIYVTCHGKAKGAIWSDVKSKHAVSVHVDDNRNNDVKTPRQLHIRTELASTGLDTHEQTYAQYSESLAWWVRYHRLSEVRTGVSGKLSDMQIQFNMPMLLAFLHELREFVDANRANKVIFLSRDGYLPQKLWSTIYPETASLYLYCSRECMRNHTETYVAYANEHITSDSVVVDLAGSLRSFAILLPHLRQVPHIFTMFFIPSTDENVSKLTFSYLLNQRDHKINNSYLEMLNYAPHWHVADVDESGSPILDQSNEYDMGLVESYHKTFGKLLQDVPCDSFDGRLEVARYAARQIHLAEPFLRKTFPGHMRLEAARNIPAAHIPTRPTIVNKQQPVELKIDEFESVLFPLRDGRPVIVGAVDKLRWTQFETWANSIHLTSFDGHVCVLTYRIDDCSTRRLRQHGFIPVPCKLERHVVVDRFRDLARLATFTRDNAWVIMLDTTDIVLQANPISWLRRDAEGYEIVVGSECIHICDQWWVRQNLKDTFPEHYDIASKRLLYNAGSFAAKAGAMRELASDTWNMCCSKPYTKPNDQDAFNILLHSDKYRSRTKFALQREGWCANIAATVIEPKDKGEAFATESLATLDRNGFCTVESGIVPVFLHHYTRNSDWKKRVEARVKSGKKVSQ